MTTSAAAAPCGGASGTDSAADFIPPRPTLPKLRDAAAKSRGCDLWSCGHVVFGEGPRGATVIFVGEQPGDVDEAEGHPFVGPAGRLLDAALEDAGIDRKSVYMTNAVKYFKFERGAKSKRRIHKKPNDTGIRACHPWLEEEIKVTKPRVIVVLGATAAQSVLRAPDDECEQARRDFFADIRGVAKHIAKS